MGFLLKKIPMKSIKYENVLLVYNKKNLNGDNETVSWKSLVKENYPEYRGIL